MKKVVSNSIIKLQNAYKSIMNACVKVVEKYPIASFFLSLMVVLVLIVISNALQPKPATVESTPNTIPVRVHTLGTSPTYTATGTLEKTNVITITAQVPGVISSIKVDPGQEVYRGSSLVHMGSNYYGSNPASIQRQIAQKNLDFSKDTYDTQKEVIQKQINLANTSQTNSEKLREIQRESKQNLETQLDLANDVVSYIDDSLKSLEDSNINGANDDLIFQTKQLKLQYMASLGQISQANSNTNYATDEENPPKELENLQKELTLKQLDIQAKSLDLQIEMQELQLKLARVSEASYFPSAPASATVEKIHVRVGESVNPGQPLVTLNLKSGTNQANILVPENIAKSIRAFDTSIINIGGTLIEAMPTYVSTVKTDGTMYSVLYHIENLPNGFDGQYISAQIPVGLPDTLAANPTVPLDAIFQSSENSYVFITSPDNTAQSKTVTLGEVIGSYVYIQEGLDYADQVILNRSVVNGDKIEIQTN